MQSLIEKIDYFRDSPSNNLLKDIVSDVSISLHGKTLDNQINILQNLIEKIMVVDFMELSLFELFSYLDFGNDIIPNIQEFNEDEDIDENFKSKVRLWHRLYNDIQDKYFTLCNAYYIDKNNYAEKFYLLSAINYAKNNIPTSDFQLYLNNGKSSLFDELIYEQHKINILNELASAQNQKIYLEAKINTVKGYNNILNDDEYFEIKSKNYGVTLANAIEFCINKSDINLKDYDHDILELYKSISITHKFIEKNELFYLTEIERFLKHQEVVRQYYIYLQNKYFEICNEYLYFGDLKYDSLITEDDVELDVEGFAALVNLYSKTDDTLIIKNTAKIKDAIFQTGFCAKSTLNDYINSKKVFDKKRYKQEVVLNLNKIKARFEHSTNGYKDDFKHLKEMISLKNFDKIEKNVLFEQLFSENYKGTMKSIFDKL